MPRKSKHRDLVLVTGASSGIGEAMAVQFARHGHDLVIVARSKDKLKALAADLQKKYDVQVCVIATDLGVQGAPEKLLAAIKRRKLAVDILVNNAGINEAGAFVTMPLKRSQEIIALNVAAATAMLSCFVPPMVKRGHGRVLNIASTSSFVPVPNMATYAASKAYLLSITESLSVELGGTGVTVTALCPGVVATDMMDSIQSADPDFAKSISFNVLDAAHVATEGYDACMSGSVVHVPGLTNKLTAVFSRVLPKRMVRLVTGKMAH